MTTDREVLATEYRVYDQAGHIVFQTDDQARLWRYVDSTSVAVRVHEVSHRRAFRPTIDDEVQPVLKDVCNEIARAIAKHGRGQTPLNPAMFNEHKLIILVEEVGEVARAITYDEGSTENLRAELIQVAAMAATWALSLGLPEAEEDPDDVW